MIVPTAHTWLCPETFVPRHVRAQHELWTDTIMSLDNNNIIIVSTRLCVNLIGENTSMLNSCCAQTWLWPHDYNMSGKKCVLAQVWAQTCVGTNVCGACGHERVSAQTFLGTIMWAQACMGTNVWSPIGIEQFHCISFSVATEEKKLKSVGPTVVTTVGIVHVNKLLRWDHGVLKIRRAFTHWRLVKLQALSHTWDAYY